MRVKSSYLNRFDGFVQFIEIDIGMTKNSFMKTKLNVHLKAMIIKFKGVRKNFSKFKRLKTVGPSLP